MMGAAALPQAQTGLAAILAALGPATPAATGKGGFEQLITALPGGAPTPVDGLSAATTPVAGVAADTEIPSLPAAMPTLTINPTLSQAGPASMVVPDTGVADPVVAPEAPAAPAAKPAESAPAPEANAAAAAASLLIAVATPRAATTTAKPAADTPEKSDAAAEDEAPAATAAPAPAAAAHAAVVTVVTAAVADPAQPASPDAAATVAVALAAPTSPASTGRPETPAVAEAEDAAPRSAATIALPDAARPTDKPVKAALARPAREDAVATTPARAVKVDGAALPLPAGKPGTEGPRPAVDTGASMAVLFGQPATQGAAAAADIARAAPVTERLLDMGSDDQWIAQLAADIAATKSETGDLSFRLMPRHLGRLDVAMTMDADGALSMKLDTQHEATAAIVHAAQPRLVEDLRQQGVRVAEAQVTHTPAETGRQQQQPQGQGRQAAPGASHLIETAPERPGADRNQRTADRRGRFA